MIYSTAFAGQHGDGVGFDVDMTETGAILKNDPKAIRFVSIRDVRVNFDSDVNVESIRKKHGNTLTPWPAKPPEKTIAFDDNKKGEPFPTGVRIDPGDGKPPIEALAKSQSDDKGNVKTLTLPTSPEVTVQNPKTPDGKDVTAAQLAAVAKGQQAGMTVIDSSNGRSYQVGAPQSPGGVGG